MRLFSIYLSIIVLAICATARAAPVASFPDPHLVPDVAGQRLAVVVTDADPVNRVNMTIRAAVNGGGPDWQAGLELGPVISDIEVDAAGTLFGTTIFSGATFLLDETTSFSPQLRQRDVEADDADEAAFNGLATLLVMDTTGLGVGHHTIDLSTDVGDTAFGPDSVTTQATLTVSALSDLTNNLFVDFEDLTVLLANWNQNGGRLQGNLVDPLSTTVGFGDLTVLLSEWTGPGPGPSPEAAIGVGAAVPEPSTLLLSALGLMSLFARGRRRSRLPSGI
ncbi:MAG: PEP-CTERM sorting domain-containing protein [Planctomycetes bacterium]|nr:PEP-CTERM sorting domain-containing protein [Planctomycetota bacterium]